VAIVGVAYFLSGIMLPFALAAFVAYAFNPIVTKLQVHHIPRWLAALTVSMLVVAASIAALLAIVPLFIEQFSRLLTRLPLYIVSIQTWIEPYVPEAEAYFHKEILPQLETFAREQASNLARYAGGMLQGLVQGGVATVASLSLLAMTPVLIFFFMRDWPKMTDSLDNLIPRYSYKTVTTLWREIDTAIAGFLRGQLSVCVVLGLFYAISLTIVGLEYGFAIGMIAGFFTFVPYVGTVIGGVASIGVAMAQYGWGNLPMIGIVAGIFVAGQVLEGNILVPKLVGDKVGLHPLWVIFALFAFGTLMGFLGLLLAIPLAAIVAVLLRYAIGQYQNSGLYKANA
jgi:predicted PurR-regulated permease PerM